MPSHRGRRDKDDIETEGTSRAPFTQRRGTKTTFKHTHKGTNALSTE